MSLDIQEIDPCEGCMRGKYDFDFGEQAAPEASAYLALSALEAARAEVPNGRLEDMAANFLHSSYGLRIPNSSKGAVGFCGRKIGRGACESWIVNEETGEIESRVEDEALPDAT